MASIVTSRAGGGGRSVSLPGLALLAVVAGCGGPQEPPRSVLLVLVDALRADRLGCYGYRARDTSPRLDAFAADATRFEHAISSTPWTLPSMATLFTGLYPRVHGAALASDIGRWLTDRAGFEPVTALDASRTTLAEVLRAHGFATAGFVHGSYPAPEFGTGQGFDVYEANQHPGIRGNVEALLAWLDRERPDRFFAYLHTAEVHSPYTPPSRDPRWPPDHPDERVRAVARALDEERARYREFEFDPDYRGWLDGSWGSLRQIRVGRPLAPRDVEHLGALYDRGIAYTDHWIGRLLDALAARDLLERTVVIVTSDHGDELLDHGGIEHSRTYFEEMMRVPLVVRVPGRGDGRVVEEQVGLIDVAPTVLELLGVPAPPMQGRSLVPAIDGAALPARAIVGEASQDLGVQALRTNAWKYVRDAAGGERLYDLAADPAERADVCATERSTCDGLGRELGRWERETNDAAARFGLPEAAAAAPSPATRERLRQMGYAD
jgi:arylsulfatase A-like enzyme